MSEKKNRIIKIIRVNDPAMRNAKLRFYSSMFNQDVHIDAWVTGDVTTIKDEEIIQHMKETEYVLEKDDCSKRSTGSYQHSWSFPDDGVFIIALSYPDNYKLRHSINTDFSTITLWLNKKRR